MEGQGELKWDENPPAFSDNLLPHDGEVFYHGPLFSSDEADQIFQYLRETTSWQHDEGVMFGKPYRTAREVAWFADQKQAYSYSGHTHQAAAWTPFLQIIKKQVEAQTKTRFQSCLLNRYHHGEEGMGWHQDDEYNLLPDAPIASLSFGAERRFDFRHRETREKVSLMLAHGSLLVMAGTTQRHWQHQLPKSKKVTSERINLTFRCLRKTSA